MFIYHYLFILVLKSPDGEWPITYTHTHTQLSVPPFVIIVLRGTTFISERIACVAAVSFSFPGGDRTGERRSTDAWREQKLGRSGEGVSGREGEGGRKKRNNSLASPLPLLLIFPSQFRSLWLSLETPKRDYTDA